MRAVRSRRGTALSCTSDPTCGGRAHAAREYAPHCLGRLVERRLQSRPVGGLRGRYRGARTDVAIVAGFLCGLRRLATRMDAGSSVGGATRVLAAPTGG